jgi:threonine/homoserine/homoserine lactone efflux protein
LSRSCRNSSAPGEALPQFLVLGATFLVLAALNAALYGFFAGRLRDAVENAAVRRRFNRCGGSVLIGAGIFTATLQRSQ